MLGGVRLARGAWKTRGSVQQSRHSNSAWYKQTTVCFFYAYDCPIIYALTKHPPYTPWEHLIDKNSTDMITGHLKTGRPTCTVVSWKHNTISLLGSCLLYVHVLTIAASPIDICSYSNDRQTIEQICNSWCIYRQTCHTFAYIIIMAVKYPHSVHVHVSVIFVCITSYTCSHRHSSFSLNC